MLSKAVAYTVIPSRWAAWLTIVFLASAGDGHAARLLADSASAQAPQTQTAPPPDLAAFPAGPAPASLAAVRLPDTEDAIDALIQRLPPAVDGRPRVAVRPANAGAIVVGYGEEPRLGGEPNPFLRFQALDLRRGDFFPSNWTGGQVIGFVAQANTRAEAGRDGDLFWMREERPATMPGAAGAIVIYGMTWGRADSPWLFSVQGETRESRDALLAAVVAAAEAATSR